ncbi:hypothetical protein Q7P35_008961 [Cladosporium inversicolor]
MDDDDEYGEEFEDLSDGILERFAYLENSAALAVYILYKFGTIAVSSAAGPAAVATGAHIAHTTATGRSLCIGLLLAAIRESGVQVGGFFYLLVSRLHIDADVSDRRMLINNYAFLLPDSGIRTWVVLVLVFVSLAGIVLVYMILAMGFAVGLAALGARLAIGHIPVALLFATIPAISYLSLFQILRLYQLGDIPLSIPNYAIAGMIYAEMCERQGYWVCSKGTAAGSGAVFAVVSSNATAIFTWVYLLVNQIRLMVRMYREWKGDVPWDSDGPGGFFAIPPGAKKSPAGSILFGLSESPDQLLLGPKFKISKEDLKNAMDAERKELGQHLEMQQVFLSRPVGLDKGSHYVLIVGKRKYELRLHGSNQRSDRKKKGEDCPQLRYNTDLVAVHPCEPDAVRKSLDTIHRRRLWNPNTQSYATNLFDVLLVGWTTGTAEEIDHICSTTIENWVYRRLINTDASGNCQNFVRIVADRICRKDVLASYPPQRLDQESDSRARDYHASNWDWFMRDVYGPIQQAQYNRRRANFWENSNVPLSIVRLRSPLEAGSEIIRFTARLQQWNPCKSDPW